MIICSITPTLANTHELHYQNIIVVVLCEVAMFPDELCGTQQTKNCDLNEIFVQREEEWHQNKPVQCVPQNPF